MTPFFEAVLFVLFIAASALFAAMEIAFTGVSRLRAKALFKQGKPGSEALMRLKEKPRKMLVTILVWNNVANVAASAVATVLFTELFGSTGVGIAIGAVTLSLLVAGDIVPKILASVHTEWLALFLASFTEVLIIVSTPLIAPVDALIVFLTQGMGKEVRRPLLTEDDLDTLITIGVEEGTVGENEARLVRDALDFNDQIVDNVMTPAKEVEYMSSKLTVKQATAQSIASRHHRFPVQDEKGKVLGVVHEKMLLDANTKGRGDLPVTAVMLAPLYVKRHTPISHVFELFQKRKRKIAAVVDENGIDVGVITLEDIVEEIIDDLRNIETEPLTPKI